MEDMLPSILSYNTLPPSQARKLHHLSHTPPEYWTAKERMLSGQARTRWLHEERNRASTGGNPAILDHIWPIGPYWPNGGVLVGGESRRRAFRNEVGRMRYRDQERANAHARTYGVQPLDIHSLPSAHLSSLLQQGDWTAGEPNPILNERARARSAQRKHPFSNIGRANLHFSSEELLQNGRFGAMVGAETEEDRYAGFGWERLGGPFYGPRGRENWDADFRPRVYEAGDGLGRGRGGGRDDGGPPPFWR